MDVVIHAGTFKTGSTAVQQYLYAHRESLIKKGMLFPLAGLSENGKEIGYRHSRFIYEHKQPSWPKLIAALKDEIALHQPQTLILSSEAWSRPDASTSLFALLDELAVTKRQKVTVCFVVRNVYDYAVSHYREFTRRWGWSLPFHRYLHNRRRFFDYNELLTPFIKNRQLNIELLPYHQNVAEALLNKMGLHTLDEFTAQPMEKTNVALSAADIELKRRANLLAKPQHREIPPFNELLAFYGLTADKSYYIETFPNEAFVSRYDRKYQKTFRKMTGLSEELLLPDNSVFNRDDAIPLENVAPILDLLFTRYLETK